MLNFKKIGLEDMETYKRFSALSGEISCEDTFANLFVWQNAYKNMMALKDENLFIKSGYGQNECFRLPIGKDPLKGFYEILEYTNSELPYFWTPDGDTFRSLPESFKERYIIEEDSNSFDYIYKQSDLALLPGKKYHSKRNHISAFSRSFNWEYKNISDVDKAKIFECAEKWYEENAERLDKYMLDEKDGIKFMLKHLQVLNLKGGCILVGGEVVAFTLGSEINRQVFDIHIEKALGEYSGAYSVINREFAARELSSYEYINREDDMGLPGLRKAKLSYKPEIILKKYLLTPKEKYRNIDACRNIYRQAFGDDAEFENLLFKSCSPNIKVLQKDGKAVSFAFLLPCNIKKGSELFKAFYIYAAATEKGERKKGYMSELLEEIKKKTDGILILRPADGYLIKYYGKLGFVSHTASDTEKDGFCVLPDGGFKTLTETADSKTNEKFTLMSFNSPFFLDGIYFPDSMP